MAIHLEIVTPEKKVFSDTVDNVYLPGADGEVGILAAHAAMVTSLQAGILTFAKKSGQTSLAIGPGFAEISNNTVKVLTDSAFANDQIDEAIVEEAMRRAEEQLSSMDHSADAEEVAHLQGIIAKSLAQIKLKRRV